MNILSNPSLLRIVFCAALIALSGLPSASAAVLLQYGFGTSAGTYDPTTVATGIQSLSSTRNGSGGGAFSSSAGLPAYSLILPALNATTTESGAVSSGDYFEFTVRVNAGSGQQFNLSNLSFDYGLGTGGTYPNSSFAASFFVRSSLDSYATTLGSIYSVETTDGASVSQKWGTTASISLSASPFQGASEVTFRIYNYNSASVASAFARLDNVTVQGVLIPEPSAGFLLGIGMLAFLGLRREGRRSAAK